MKADTTRSTFKQTKHYNGVLMQQGRVQLDADWNEQIDITGHRIESETIDVIGPCGAPMHDPGFHIVAKIGDLSDEEKNLPENQNLQSVNNDLIISGGRYYVDGILCENDHIIAYTKQDDVPNLSVTNQPGTYLAYLDVWSRHVTALEDPAIREVALGGPDTATRSKTIWQVKLFPADPNLDCSSDFKKWNDEIAPGNGVLAAQAEAGASPKDPCIVAPGAGYRRLENQHYRVEVHNSGSFGAATFKWSRDNGSIVAKWESQTINDLTVSSIGRDKVLSFAAGQWVELTDDNHELLGTPGRLVQLTKVEGNVLTIDPNNAIPKLPAINIADFPKNPKVRRWDMAALLKPTNQSPMDLEDGVQVKFIDGTFKTGDYWLIPARTATGDVEWPIDPATNKAAFQLPFGIKHHYCRLAVAKLDAGKWTITDCRHLFPPLTELINFFYVGGDGQEAMPDLTQPNSLTPALPQSLEAGVTNDIWPVKGAQVRFKVLTGGGKLNGSAAPALVFTAANGVAGCAWSLGPATQSQQVEAVLLDKYNNPICEPIHYTANLSVASQVAYKPKDGCVSLQNQKNVQDAIDTLAALTSLYKVSGDDQSKTLSETLDPMVVIAASKCGPIAGMKVTFTAKPPGATITTPQPVTTDAQGLAKCEWKLGSGAGAQVVEAVLQAGPNPIVPPVSVQFQAQVRMLPGADPGFQVTKISVPVPGAAAIEFKNNMDLVFTSLAPGVQLDCNDAPDPNALSSKDSTDNPVCYITVDVPFPYSADEKAFFPNVPPACHKTITLGGAASVSQNTIKWLPTTPTMNWLGTLFAQIQKSPTDLPQRVLARLTLKGSFIWSLKNPEVLLDGDVFAKKSQGAITLPSGDQRKGGTLDMWFWLIPPGGFSLIANSVKLGIKGSVLNAANAPLSGVQVHLSPTNRTYTTSADGGFSFGGLTIGQYEVSAKVAGVTETEQVFVGEETNPNP